MPGKGARGGADIRRAAVALLLVAVAAIGLRASGAFSAAGSPEILGLGSQAVYWTIAGAEVVMAVAGIVLLILRMIWARKSGKPRERRRRSIWWVLLLPLFAFGLSKILQRLRQQHPAAVAAVAHGAPARTGAAGHLRVGNPWPLLVLFAVVALGAAALTVYRRRRAVLSPREPDLEPDPEPLVAALAAGAQVLHEDPEPRAAIIGCYAAMEHSLADAGRGAGQRNDQGQDGQAFGRDNQGEGPADREGGGQRPECRQRDHRAPPHDRPVAPVHWSPPRSA